MGIDAPWGGGKTIFLKMWAQHMQMCPLTRFKPRKHEAIAKRVVCCSHEWMRADGMRVVCCCGLMAGTGMRLAWKGTADDYDERG